MSRRPMFVTDPRTEAAGERSGLMRMSTIGSDI